MGGRRPVTGQFLSSKVRSSFSEGVSKELHQGSSHWSYQGEWWRTETFMAEGRSKDRGGKHAVVQGKAIQI